MGEAAGGAGLGPREFGLMLDVKSEVPFRCPHAEVEWQVDTHVWRQQWGRGQGTVPA